MKPLDQILHAMNEADLSQRSLARSMETTEAYVSLLLREPFNPTLKTLKKLAIILCITIEIEPY